MSKATCKSRSRWGWLLLLAALSAGAVLSGCADETSSENDDTPEESRETFDRSSHLEYKAEASSSCAGEVSYTLEDLRNFSDIVAVGEVTAVNPATEPIRFNVDGIDFEECDGTLVAGLDLEVALDETFYAAEGVDVPDTITLRITAEELDDVWSTTVTLDGDRLSWLGRRQVYPGNDIVFSAIFLEDKEIFNLSGHPFAFAAGDDVIGTSDDGYGFGCFDFPYASELYTGELADVRAKVASAENEADTDAEPAEVRRSDAEQGFLPDTAICFISGR
jgi:hypothetical protein